MWGTKTSKLYDIWIFETRGTLIYGFKYTNTFWNIYEIMETRLKMNFMNLKILEIENSENIGPDLEKTGTEKSWRSV